MDHSLAKNLAYNLQNLRKKQNLSQENLSKMAQIPRSTLTHIESGHSNPTLENLAKLASALQIRIEELIQTPRDQSHLLKSNELKIVLKSNGSVRIFKLIPDFINGVDIDRMEFQPHARLGGVPHTKGTKEFFTCIEGRFQITVSGVTHIVSPGDVLSFPGDLRHSYQNIAKQKSIALSVIAFSYP